MIDDSLNSDKIYVSCSKSTKLSGAYHRHFFPVELKSLNQLAELMNERVWSPIVWKDGLRLKQNFLSCHFIALDFDDGRMSLKDTQTLCDSLGYSYILGTSKSHQKEKKTDGGTILPACDRFRLVLVSDQGVSSREVYEYNMYQAMNLWPCDPSCKDGARFFYGSPNIVTVKAGGKKIPWAKIPHELTEAALKERQNAELAHYKEEGELPRWIINALKHGGPAGGRHKMCYRLGATMVRLGYREEQIIGLVMKSPLRDIGQTDVERAVANGAERATRG